MVRRLLLPVLQLLSANLELLLVRACRHYQRINDILVIEGARLARYLDRHHVGLWLKAVGCSL